MSVLKCVRAGEEARAAHSLGENQLAHAGGGQAVGAAVVPNLHEAFALQQLLALQGRVQGRRLASSMVGWQI